MKQLYEKYCYLNEYLERKFDDDDNIKLLKMRGFKIVTREDAQTQFFTRIKLNIGETLPSVVDQPEKTSLDLFITSCCNLTKFETDRIDAHDLDATYQVNID